MGCPEQNRDGRTFFGTIWLDLGSVFETPHHVSVFGEPEGRPRSGRICSGDGQLEEDAALARRPRGEVVAGAGLDARVRHAVAPLHVPTPRVRDVRHVRVSLRLQNVEE